MITNSVKLEYTFPLPKVANQDTAKLVKLSVSYTISSKASANVLTVQQHIRDAIIGPSFNLRNSMPISDFLVTLSVQEGKSIDCCDSPEMWKNTYLPKLLKTPQPKANEVPKLILLGQNLPILSL